MPIASRLPPYYDAIIVGARCAGAATALLLARAGLKVLVIDRHSRGTDTLSTHALMRTGVVQLARFGLLEAVAATDAPPVRNIVFHFDGQETDVAIKLAFGVDALYAPRRFVLDGLLQDAAEAAGADLRFGLILRRVIGARSGRVCGIVAETAAGASHLFSAGIVIGADGVRSAVAEAVGAAKYRAGRHAAAVLYAYWAGLPQHGYHWHYRRGLNVGVIPTNGGESCVFALMPAQRFATELKRNTRESYPKLIAEMSPALAATLAQARQVGALRGFAGEPGFLRQAHGPGWALVGDAGYFKDPITAHGISDALRDAELLAAAVISGTPSGLAQYQAARDRLSLPLFEATDAIASFAWDIPRLQALQNDLKQAMNEETAFMVQRGPLAAGANGSAVRAA